MSLGETAQLAVELKINGITAYTSGMAQAEAATKKLNTSAGGITGGLKSVEKGFASLGGALGHAGGQIKGLVTGPLGLIGLTGGLFSLGGIFESSIRHASDMGFAVEKLTGLTGESATEMSRLLVTFEKFGITADKTAQIVGFTEKTLGNLAVNGALQQKIMENYGLSIRDTSGHLKDFGTILGNVADYYNSSTSEANKAALAAQLFGRGYAQMIPILKLGSQGIKDAEQSAADLGLTLTDQNAKDLKDYRGAIRDVGEAIGGLQLQIGLALIPEVKKLAVGLTDFLEHGGSKQIVDFFKAGAKFAEDMGGVIRDDVVPVFQGIADAWGKVPPELKQLLITGFVANKTSKFLFDFGVGDLAKLGGGLLQRGGSPATPLFVSDVTGGAGAVAGAGIAAALTSAAVISAFAGGIYLSLQSIGGFVAANNAGAAAGMTPAEIAAQRYQNSSPADQEFFRKHNYGQIPTAPSGGHSLEDRDAERAMQDLQQSIEDTKDADSSVTSGLKDVVTAIRSWIDHIGGREGVKARSVAKFKKDPSDAAVDHTFQRDLVHAAKMIARSTESDAQKLADLKVLEKTGNAATASAIKKLEPNVSVTVTTTISPSSLDRTKISMVRYGPYDPSGAGRGGK